MVDSLHILRYLCKKNDLYLWIKKEYLVSRFSTRVKDIPKIAIKAICVKTYEENQNRKIVYWKHKIKFRFSRISKYSINSVNKNVIKIR